MVALKIARVAVLAWLLAIAGYLVLWLAAGKSRGEAVALIVWGAPVYFAFFGVCFGLVAFLQSASRRRSPIVSGLLCGIVGCVPLLWRPLVLALMNGGTFDGGVLPIALVMAGLPGFLFGAGLARIWTQERQTAGQPSAN